MVLPLLQLCFSIEAMRYAWDTKNPRKAKEGEWILDSRTFFQTSLLVLVMSCGIGFVSLEGGDVKRLTGAGATFPYPIYSRWMYEYQQNTGVQVNYQSIGSGGGIAQIKARTVDFGASDAPLKPEELDKAGLMQFPMIMGGVVIAVNVPGVPDGKLKLSQQVLSDIFLGKIRKWNDVRIKAINPGLNLPGRNITVVHRADGSGTTWIFTNYLAKISAEWKKRVGYGKAVKWPAGVGGKGNEGVSAYIRRIRGAIGYVEYAYALQNKMNCAQLENKDGFYVRPVTETFQAAAANADWKNAPGFYQVLTNQPGKDSWPITGASFILIYKNQSNAAKAKALIDYFRWCYQYGDNEAIKLHYIPIPDAVVKLVEEAWRNQLKVNGKALLASSTSLTTASGIGI